jgi:RND family efflux transporter MFP subunit
MKSARPWLLFGLGLAAFAIGFWLWRAGPLSVETVHPRFGSVVELVYATGYVEAQQPVSVAARVTAPVERVLVDEGDHVRRGQILLTLNDDEQRGQLAQAVSEARRTTLDEQRSLTLFREGWLTRTARDRAVGDATTARAAEVSARARVNQQVVRAGIDGVVLKRDVYPGDLAAPSRTLILLGDPKRVRVTATVDERDVPKLGIGQVALMSSDAWPGRVIKGRLTEITPGGDPNQRAFRARLAIDDGTPLPMGMSLEVNIITRELKQALLIPATAVVDGHVWLVEQKRARKTSVRTGLAAAADVQILSGVTSSSIVIRSPPSDLKDGQRVRLAPAQK